MSNAPHYCEYEDNGVLCGNPAWVGIGSPPKWLCFDHFAAQLSHLKRRVRRWLND